jgi:hypothetical protein
LCKASRLDRRKTLQRTIYIRDELVLEARPDGPYILLRREGEPGAVRIYLNEVRYLADAMCAMAAEMVGSVVGDEGTSDDRNPA